jgi:putative SOS response-associated peptidase YedK
MKLYDCTTAPSPRRVRIFFAEKGISVPTVQVDLRNGEQFTPGLWDEWHDRASGETLKSCTMIICEPNDFVAEVHDRVPILLSANEFEPWLKGEAGLELLKPAPNDLLQKWLVSKRVNSSRASDDDPTLIERVELASV